MIPAQRDQLRPGSSRAPPRVFPALLVDRVRPDLFHRILEKVVFPDSIIEERLQEPEIVIDSGLRSPLLLSADRKASRVLVELDESVLVNLADGDIPPELMDNPEPVLDGLPLFDLFNGPLVLNELVGQISERNPGSGRRRLDPVVFGPVLSVFLFPAPAGFIRILGLQREPDPLLVITQAHIFIEIIKAGFLISAGTFLALRH